MWLLLGSVSQSRSRVPTQTLWKADTVPCAAVVPAAVHRFHLNPLSVYFLCLGRKIIWGRGNSLCKEQVLNSEIAPARKREAHLVSRNTSWETWQVSIHFTIMKLIISKKFRCLLLLREKGCFLLYKAASYVFWYTIVWTSVFSW